ncbi:SDR family NAD(P)-dependent oxidoreductase [Actinocrispum wychmicini]|uniref:3-oxoacyl-[acyl-carrier protein] reductase n=1 Tax=Actinocrispum wychmicini TaxID=1213861 RepID=A0A4R2JQ42_9PSEU|nr:SDR family oxidoreductase [Actinocrispum wychmicini]TCO62323.1 3-oxoacyl-[acyl-carrier protein] reductase [Actinocrispum wychmicini]
MDDRGLLTGRVALVTGGSRGIGAGIALALGQQGADVVVNYHTNADAAAGVVAGIEAAGSRALAVQADATDADQVAAMVRTATEALGDIDVLVCNTVGEIDDAVERFMSGRTMAMDCAAEILHRTAAQLAATLYPCREVLPGMRRRGGGSVVLIGAAGTRGGRPEKGIAEIAVAKAAQEALARSLASELGPDRVRVNTVAPGMIPTDANAGPWQPMMITEIAKTTPLGQVGTAADVGAAVVAFAADLTRHVTGAFVGVDGGRTMD